MKNITIGQKIFAVFSKVIALLAVILILFPIFWLVRTSLIPSVRLFDFPPALFIKPTLAAYYRAFYTQHLAMRTLTSLAVSLTATFVAVLSGAMSSYAITRFDMRFTKSLPFAFLFLRMVPGIAVLLPVFLMYSALNLIDTFSGLTSVYIAGAIPTVVWMMWGYFRDLPREIEESAYIDGSGYFNTFFRIFFRIVLPITTPAVASVAILSFTHAWNEYMMATILTRTHIATLPPAVVSLMNLTELVWDNISAGGVVLSVPVVILCIFAQKYFVKGLTVGAVKG